MKSRPFNTAWLLTLIAVLAIPTCTTAQTRAAKQYAVTDLGTLGGAYSFGYGLNNAGVVAGGAATATQTDFVSQTAFLWFRGHMINVGTLDGPACPDCSSEAGGPNAFGLSPVLSETATVDPNGEDFCGFGTHRQCLAAVWRNGVLRALPTLPGGNNSQAYWANAHGQVVGFSETGVEDATCASTPLQKIQYEGVVWQPDGRIRELTPYPGDTVSFAFGINDSGQAVGSSGLCADTSIPPVAPNGTHAVLWQPDGSIIDLGNLGGDTNNVATGINNAGEVVGNSLSSDGTIHPFLWRRSTGMQDLGAFPGAVATIAPCCHTLNDEGEVVGFYVDTNFNISAFHWKNNTMVDLNTLLPAGSPWFLLQALSINTAGQITGVGLINGEIHAFLATPISEHAAGRCIGKPPVLPAKARGALFGHRH
ncbi:MAG TPA: hypothetical protein VFA13_04360 [Candidatus Acidoferrum sp.]|nr:hypothetical protein [Candidatus Acidoferrum sp.]